MRDDRLLRASEREQALYRELLAVYRLLHAHLVDARREVDAAWVAEQHGKAAAVTDALAGLAAQLAPHRLTGSVVASAVTAAWRASAELAAEANALNASLVTLARARQTALARGLVQAARGRRALAGYRPAVATAPGVIV